MINLAVVPAAWLEWFHAFLGSLPKSVTESLGLYRDRLHPSGSPAGRDIWWQVYDDADAQEAAHDVVVQLEAHGLPTLLNLLDRENMLAQYARGTLAMPRALILRCSSSVPKPSLSLTAG